jgi:fructose-1,6-bisphosphatase
MNPLDITSLEYRATKVVHIGSSEETPEEVDLGAPADSQGFSVSFDPLDGSSIIDTNFSVGSIFGVWPGRAGNGGVDAHGERRVSRVSRASRASQARGSSGGRAGSSLPP